MAELNKILNGFRQNAFDPNTNSSDKLPDTQGNYLFCLRIDSKFHFPIANIVPKLSSFEGLEVIYTGIASKSFRNRDYKSHFGDNAGRSTLRKSLGVLFGYNQIPRDKNPSSGKTKFHNVDELNLTSWMKSNLLMFYFVNLDWKNDETQLISYFNPPLNLKENQNTENLEFRKRLKQLRVKK